jgi:predicted RNA-binding protein YlqC (UPF0109 family)
MAEGEGVQTGGEASGEIAASDTDVVAGTLTYLARSLVDHVDDVRIERVEGDRGTVYRLHVNPEDMGRVIGRSGRMARAIRQVTRAAAARAGVHILVEIAD